MVQKQWCVKIAKWYYLILRIAFYICCILVKVFPFTSRCCFFEKNVNTSVSPNSEEREGGMVGKENK